MIICVDCPAGTNARSRSFGRVDGRYVVLRRDIPRDSRSCAMLSLI